MLADWTQTDWNQLGDNVVKIITALSALVAAIGVLLSKLRGDKILNAATTAVVQNQQLAEKAEEQVQTTVAVAQRLEATTQQTAARLSKETHEIAATLAEKSDAIHEKVNGQLSTALKNTADALEKVADITGRSADKITAGSARMAFNDNERSS